MPRKDIDYSKCVIYKIVCNDFNIKDLYVGHTTDLVKRRSLHKSVCNNCNSKYHNTKIYTIVRENGGWENWSIVVIEIYNTCKNAEEARTRERYWFEQLNANLNMIRPLATNEDNNENKRQFYLDNKEKILDKTKKYYLDNKDIVLEQHKQYYLDNKENILEKNKLYNEKHKDKRLECSKEYYANNKEKIRERKEKPFICDCGSIFRTDSRLDHMKSKKHLEFCELII